jgi:hypothetical protein
MANLDSTNIIGKLRVSEDIVCNGKVKGTATAADKLSSNTLVGSTSLPVYFQNGVPSACAYALLASVPAVTTAQNGYVLQVVNGKLQPVQIYQYSATDLTAGTSSLATGSLYFVYQ